MPYDHDNQYESSTDSNDSDYMDDYENAFLSKCPECEEYRQEDEINREHGICQDCVDDIEDD